MTPDEFAVRLRDEFPEWTDDQTMTAAQSIYRAGKEIEAELARDHKPALSMLERFLSRRVLELEQELALQAETLTAVRSLVDARYGVDNDHSRRTW